ncbi:MAG TPA: response regulator [Xanthobacteraceae bacterium]
MAQPLRVLMVEDDERDATLLLRELQRSHYQVTCERVDTPEAMSAALEKAPWDVVLADFTMPRFSAPAALSLVKEHALDLPFIIVSGTVGEEAAVTSLRAGAHDFLVKGSLARLVPAIERERREAGMRAERKKMRQQLLISDRMASIGLLAAGIAHEINNPLAILVANLELAAEQLALTAPPAEAAEVTQLVQDAREAAERVRLIVRDLKNFSRSDDEEKTGPVDIQGVLESSIRMASNEIRHRARLVRNYGAVPPVEGSESKLGQVFINLIVNAAQAMPEGRIEANEIGIVTRTDDAGRAVVEISDTGAGIPQNVLPHIFDVFFTTKPVGGGTGLGLAICQRIITAHGGDISVESEVGRGSIFRTVLPPAAGGSPEVAAVPSRVGSARHGRILVVDDEPMLGLTIQRTLGREHAVTAVTTAKEAYRLLSGGEQFELILCDLMMPEMSGMDLHAELIKLAPDQANKFVFMTGGAFTEKATRFLAHSSNPTIKKPFKTAKLRELVQSLLG